MSTRLLFACICAALLSATVAFSQENRKSFHGVGHEKLHHWYSTLVDPLGISCCHDQDCRPTDDRVNEKGEVEVMVDGVWMLAPNDRILKKSSPDLGSHVCATKQLYTNETFIRCVIIGSGV